MSNVKIEVPTGYTVDEEASTFTNIVFKKDTVVKSWEELVTVHGWYISYKGFPRSTQADTGSKDKDYVAKSKQIWATKGQAEAYIAMAQLSQLLKHVNGDWVPNWKDYHSNNYVIGYYEDNIAINSYSATQHFLAFEIEESRNQFLKNHRALIEQAKPLL